VCDKETETEREIGTKYRGQAESEDKAEGEAEAEADRKVEQTEVNEHGESVIDVMMIMETVK